MEKYTTESCLFREAFVSIICLIFFTVINCGGKPQNIQEYEPASKVILGPGDVLAIKFFHTPELNETQTVRPDGFITLQLIGEVEIKGKTPHEVQNELLKLYSSQLKNPDISVIVESFYSNRVFVGGEVNNPGYIETSGRITALEAIMQSGGFNMLTAKINDILVIRSKDGERIGYKLNLKPALKGYGDQPFFLEPYDIVYVPKTKFAAVGDWIDTHIDNLFPQILVGTFGIYLLRDIITD